MIQFAHETDHTGSRLDYEQYMGETVPLTPQLRSVYPIVSHDIKKIDDWSLKKIINEDWFKEVSFGNNEIYLTNWYKKKQKQLKIIGNGIGYVKNLFK